MNSTLKLSTKLSPSGKTQLAEYFATPPFKVMTLPAYADAWTNGLNAIQMSSSPGLLSGDRIDIQITLAELTALSLNTQAFTRVQAMNEGETRSFSLKRIAIYFICPILWYYIKILHLNKKHSSICNLRAP